MKLKYRIVKKWGQYKIQERRWWIWFDMIKPVDLRYYMTDDSPFYKNLEDAEIALKSIAYERSPFDDNTEEVVMEMEV